MIPVTANALAPEHRREAQPLGNLRFGNKFVRIFRLANDEFTDLEYRQLEVLGFIFAKVWLSSLPEVQYL